ncbi:MAG: hypothetical protein AAF639_39625 [Chloroflexota bacterium]
MRKVILFLILIATLIIFVAATESPQLGSVKFNEGVPLEDAIRLLENHEIEYYGVSWYTDTDTPVIRKIRFRAETHTPETIETEFWREYIPLSQGFFERAMARNGEQERYLRAIQALKSLDDCWEASSCPTIYVKNTETYGTGSLHHSIDESPLVQRAELQIVTATRALRNDFFGERSKS